MDVLRRGWHLAVRWHEKAVIYAYSQARQGEGRIDPAIRVYDRREPAPATIRDQFIRLRGRRLWAVMRYRMRVRDARLLCLIEHDELCAYGWMQRADPFLRRYRWLIPKGTLLGFFWTAPQHRGRGLYGRILAHCIAISHDRDVMPLIIYANPYNTASLRGIEKAGFVRLGSYEVTSWLGGLWCTHRTISQERTIAEIMAERA